MHARVVPGQPIRSSSTLLTWVCFVVLTCLPLCPAGAERSEIASTPVPLYRVFETSVQNTKTKPASKFDGVWLNASFSSPTHKQTKFWGFYDGGNTWKLRFMPNEVGAWAFAWRFSDGSASGHGSFACVEKGRSPGQSHCDQHLAVTLRHRHPGVSNHMCRVGAWLSKSAGSYRMHRVGAWCGAWLFRFFPPTFRRYASPQTPTRNPNPTTTLSAGVLTIALPQKPQPQP